MTQRAPFRLGVLVNPYAGIGGAVALKGSDGAAIREQALQQGAKRQAPEKMARALEELIDVADLRIFTAGGEMGEQSCQLAGLEASVVYHAQASQTEAEDTQAAARELCEQNIDLLLFAGGDGTARNLFDAIADRLVVLGVPAGVKIHSGVYAVTPSGAGRVARKMATGELVSEFDAEVRDIDEEAFRQGKVTAKYHGEMRVPRELEYIQAVKMGGKEHEELVLDDIAAFTAEMIEQDDTSFYVMGSGSTVAAIMEELGLENTLLGVDVIHRGKLVGVDVTADELLRITDSQPVKLVVTLIGGQGHILGRGNQQLSPAFIRRLGKQNMIIVATKAKIQALEGRPLRFDSGDSELDEQLRGSVQVITGYDDKVLYPAV